ncbi:MAG: hypothetical protein DMF59_06045 [Acidobacteria bacterium]|nr:MAG: hypothetical protein DMF59_06045 [Acidobacteriota bacterium]
MELDERRITLITYDKQREERSWNFSDHSTNRIVFIESFALLRSTVASPLVRSDSDVERIVLDRCSTESEYLSLLADLPHSFAGDVLMIRMDSTGFLSATGRGGDRILYSLGPEDVEFYLETVRLVQPSEALQRHVLKFRPRVVENIEGKAVKAQ